MGKSPGVVYDVVINIGNNVQLACCQFICGSFSKEFTVNDEGRIGSLQILDVDTLPGIVKDKQAHAADVRFIARLDTTGSNIAFIIRGDTANNLYERVVALLKHLFVHCTCAEAEAHYCHQSISDSCQ